MRSVSFTGTVSDDYGTVRFLVDSTGWQVHSDRIIDGVFPLLDRLQAEAVSFAREDDIQMADNRKKDTQVNKKFPPLKDNRREKGKQNQEKKGK